jgi:soluble lytic murein transglycosylase-like protein
MTIDTALLLAFIEQESTFKTRAFLNDRNGGSYGLLQLDYATAQDRGFKGSAVDLYDPVVNVQFGNAQLEWLSAELTKGGKFSASNLAAAYNSGLSHILGGGTDPLYAAEVTEKYHKYAAALGITPIP